MIMQNHWKKEKKRGKKRKTLSVMKEYYYRCESIIFSLDTKIPLSLHKDHGTSSLLRL